MDAHKAKIPDIVNNSTLIEVPFFQRAYVWKEDLWERFLDDMAFVVQLPFPAEVCIGSCEVFCGRVRRFRIIP